MKNKIFTIVIIALAVVAAIIWYLAFFSIKSKSVQTSKNNSTSMVSVREQAR